MQASTAQNLLAINQRFYQGFGEQFSATRQRIQPGVRMLLPQMAAAKSILDLGCGNAELARALAETDFHGDYLGLDFSLPLLGAARFQPSGLSVAFREADLAGSEWDQPLAGSLYSVISAFAVLHHIPSQELRLGILQKVRSLLVRGGKFMHSNWQFLNSEKLKARIQPWERAGMSADQVDPGDYLLDWRAGGAGLRYVHHFSLDELNQLAASTGFLLENSFYCDGQGGRLGLYQIWTCI